MQEVTSNQKTNNTQGLNPRSLMVKICCLGFLVISVSGVCFFMCKPLFKPSTPVENKKDPQTTAGDDLWNKVMSCRVTPEYNRNLKSVVISLAMADTSLQMQHKLLLQLPVYTKIILLLPASNIGVIMEDIKGKPYENRVQIISYDEHAHRDCRLYLLFRDKEKFVQLDTGDDFHPRRTGTMWAQDLFEVAKDNTGQTILLVSKIHKYFCSTGKKDAMTVVRDNTYLEQLKTCNVDTLTIPLTFKGGNILIDEIDGRRIVFCGGDVLRTSRTVMTGMFGKELSDSQIKGIIQQVFAADELVVISADDLQPTLMYHLDQAMLFLPNRTAAVTKIIDTPSLETSKNNDIEQAKLFLSKLRLHLQRLRYKIVDIEMTKDNLVHYHHYINAIPYIDAATGQKTLLMPVFPSAQQDIDDELIKRNTAVFRSLGYDVMHVPTKAGELKGGIHCLLNVLE